MNADINFGAADDPKCIVAARIAHGYTQAQFAKIIGVRQATVADWESGTCKPSRLAQLALINFGLNGPRNNKSVGRCQICGKPFTNEQERTMAPLYQDEPVHYACRAAKEFDQT